MDDDCKMSDQNLNTAKKIGNQDKDQPERMSNCRQLYFSIAETASMMGVSQKHIRRATREGTLPCSNVGGNGRPTYRIARSDIDAWLASTRIVVGSTKEQRQEKVLKYFDEPKQSKSVKRNTST